MQSKSPAARFSASRARPPARRLCAAPANVLAGSRSSPPAPASPSSPSLLPSSPDNASYTSPKPRKTCLPTVLAGLSTGALLGAAALHGYGPEHTTIVTTAASALGPLTEFGPADVVAQGFGPSRPLWAAVLQSHAAHGGAVAATAPATQLSDVADGSLLQQARGAVAGATAAVRGATGQLCDGYNRWLEESPLACKIVTGNFFTVAGDMLAQLGTGGAGGHGGEASPAAPPAGRKRVDWARTARLCIETSAVGTPLGHWWFGLLDGRIMPEDPHCPAAVLSKMLLDQVLFAPFGLLVFFAVIKCLEGRPGDIPHTVRTSYVRALLGGYLLWPVAGVLNFALLPPEYRLLFNNCVNILWTCFLSIMSSGDGSNPASAPAVDTSSDTPTTSTARDHDVATIPSDLLATTLLVAALSSGASARASSGLAAGLMVAALEVALAAATHGSVAQQQADAEPVPVPVIVAAPSSSSPSSSSSPLLVPIFAAGSSVSVGGPCLEVCQQLEETRMR